MVEHHRTWRRSEQERLLIPAGSVTLEGDLVVPSQATSLVVFSHGSGSSRYSPRNHYIASVLRRWRQATLLLDLLTPEEDRFYENRSDIDLLTDRLTHAVRWATAQLPELPIGLFGASTGAASALRAAAQLPQRVTAVVSRGGRPDLTGTTLPKVRSACLFIVGGEDTQVIQLNQQAYQSLGSREKQILVIPGATHLFGEPGALEEVAAASATWFAAHRGR